MTERERWIVYPLLFLALGVSLRDKMLHRTEVDVVNAKQIQADVVFAKEIHVVDPTGVSRVAMRSVDYPTKDRGIQYSGEVTIQGHDGKPVVRLRANHQLIGQLVKSQEGTQDGDSPAKPKFNIHDIKEDGGVLQVFDGDKQLALALAHLGGESGLFVTNNRGQRLQLSRIYTRPEKLQPPVPNPPKPAETQEENPSATPDKSATPDELAPKPAG